jgi:hypothetical protein
MVPTREEACTMNLMKLAALKGLVLGGVFAAAALVSQPASADRDGWRGHGGGQYDGWHDRDWRGDHRGGHGWRGDDHRGWRHDRPRYDGHGYGGFVPGRYGHGGGRHDGRVWCPTHRIYAYAWELRDSRRHRHGSGYRDDGYWDRGYSGYRDRDRAYRGW